MGKKLLIYFLCIVGMVICSCSKENIGELSQKQTEEPDGSDNSDDTTIPTDPGDPDDNEPDTNSQDVSYDNSITIVYSDSGATVDNPFTEGVTVDNESGHVVITSTLTDTEINYILSGVVSDGSLKIYGEKKTGLILNGVDITNSTGAAINIQNGKKCTVTLVDGTNNRLADGTGYVYTDGEDMKGAFFSEGNMEVRGGGSLEISGRNRHGLCVDGSLFISDGSINFKEAASDGIHTNGGITIAGGSVTVRSAGDGIESESTEEPVNITGGTVAIYTTGEKGHGIKTDYNADISGGTIEVTTYGVASKAIKPKGDANITGGSITLNTAGNAMWETSDNDTSSSAGIKCGGNFTMSSGTLTTVSTGAAGKGVSADGTLTISGGAVTVTTSGAQFSYRSGAAYTSSAKGIKSSGNLLISGGTVKVRTSKAGAEGIESKATITIKGGDIDVEAYDDCINGGKHIQIDGGNIYCYGSNNDGVDSNGTLTVTGGLIVSAGSNTPEEGFDCDSNTFAITGGLLVGVGGATSKPTEKACAQRSVTYGASSYPTVRIVATSDGTELLTFKLPRSYSGNTTLLFSSPAIAASTGYTIYTGGTISGGTEFYGLYTGATWSNGSSAGTFTSGSAAGATSTVGTSGGNDKPWNPR